MVISLMAVFFVNQTVPANNTVLVEVPQKRMRQIVALGELVYQDITGKLDTVDGVRVYLL